MVAGCIIDITDVIIKWLKENGFHGHVCACRESRDAHSIIQIALLCSNSYVGPIGEINLSTYKVSFMQILYPKRMLLPQLNLAAPHFFAKFKRCINRIHNRIGCNANH